MRKEFERLPEIAAELENSDGELYWCDKQNQYRNNRVFQDSQTGWMNGAWYAWQAAKAQAVPSKLDEINNWAKWHIEDYQISESNEHDRGWYNACCAVVNMLEAQEQSK